jgi:hypothetical protein
MRIAEVAVLEQQIQTLLEDVELINSKKMRIRPFTPKFQWLLSHGLY